MSEPGPGPRRGLRGAALNVAAVLVALLPLAVPLPGPHAAPLFGALVAGSVRREGADRALAIAMIALAIAAMVHTFLVARWALRSLPRTLVLLLYLPLLAVGLWILSLGVVPRATLIQADDRPDNLAWPAACEVADATLIATRSPGDDMALAGLAWLRLGAQGDRLGLLRADPCGAVAEVALPAGTMHGIAAAAGNGATLESTWDVPRQATHWWWRRGPASPPLEIPDFDLDAGSVPVLSRDGGFLVTVERGAPPATPRVVLRALDGALAAEIDLAPHSPASFVPLEASVMVVYEAIASAEVLLCRSEGSLLAVDLAGAIAWGPIVPEHASCTTFRRGGGGWLAWDGYAEGRPYAVRWDSAAGRGIHVLPKGHGISSAAIEPDGRFVAISTGPIYNLGGVGDAVIVLDARGGREVFRDALPTYTRSEVAFVGRGVLAYSSFDGRRSTVRVVRAP